MTLPNSKLGFFHLLTFFFFVHVSKSRCVTLIKNNNKKPVKHLQQIQRFLLFFRVKTRGGRFTECDVRVLPIWMALTRLRAERNL